MGGHRWAWHIMTDDSRAPVRRMNPQSFFAWEKPGPIKVYKDKGGTLLPKMDVRKNKYQAPCKKCGLMVPPGWGLLTKEDGLWVVTHEDSTECPPF